MGRFVNPDNSAFQLALNSRIYVDKTGLIEYTNSVLNTTNAYICNSRPRRFGKSYAANMFFRREIDVREGKAMIILKGLKKLLVLPIILVLVFIWLIVKTLVSLYEIVHGIVYLFVIIFSILLIAVYGDWLQTGILAVIGFTSFLLLAVGVLGEVMLESIIKLIWSF